MLSNKADRYRIKKKKTVENPFTLYIVYGIVHSTTVVDKVFSLPYRALI